MPGKKHENKYTCYDCEFTTTKWSNFVAHRNQCQVARDKQIEKEGASGVGWPTNRDDAPLTDPYACPYCRGTGGYSVYKTTEFSWLLTHIESCYVKAQTKDMLAIIPIEFAEIEEDLDKISAFEYWLRTHNRA